MDLGVFEHGFFKMAIFHGEDDKPVDEMGYSIFSQTHIQTLRQSLYNIIYSLQHLQHDAWWITICIYESNSQPGSQFRGGISFLFKFSRESQLDPMEITSCWEFISTNITNVTARRQDVLRRLRQELAAFKGLLKGWPMSQHHDFDAKPQCHRWNRNLNPVGYWLCFSEHVNFPDPIFANTLNKPFRLMFPILLSCGWNWQVKKFESWTWAAAFSVCYRCSWSSLYLQAWHPW